VLTTVNTNFGFFRTVRPYSDPAKIYSRVCRRGLDRAVWPQVAGFNKTLLVGGKWIYGFSHIPAWKLPSTMATYSFTVLRDPLDRALSLYSSTWAHAITGRQDPNTAFLSGSRPSSGGFLQFLSSLAPALRMNQLYMWSRNGDESEAHEIIARVTFRFAGITRISEVLRESLGLNVDIPIVSQPKVRLESLPEDHQSDALRLLEPEINFVYSVVATEEHHLLSYGRDKSPDIQEVTPDANL
jgi:hypothetical protein